MSDLNFYNNFVRPLEGQGLSNEQMAEIITAQSSRYPVKEMTVNELAVALTDAGNTDADGIITRLMSSLEGASSQSFLVANKLKQLKDTSNPGFIDLGNYLQRTLLQQFAQDVNLQVDELDVNAILSLCEVPSPVSAQEVSDAKDAESNRQSLEEQEELERQQELERKQERKVVIDVYASLYNEYLSPLLSGNEALDEQQIKDALADMISNWPSN